MSDERRALRGDAATAILVAVALDMLGELPAAWHPVVWYGRLITRLERRAPQAAWAQRVYGGAMILVAVPLAVAPAIAAHRLARRARVFCTARGRPWHDRVAFALIEGAALSPFFALRLLVASGREVRQALENDDLPAARAALRSLVSRDRANLDAGLVAAAAVESLAENLSDSVIAPLLAYALFGLPGAATYRLINTFDAMIGYRGRYEHLGKAAARLDDAINLVPARLTAALLIVLAPCYGGSVRDAWRVWRRDARATASPNAGQPMAAAAGALGVRLTKVGHYALGDPARPLTAGTVRQAERMVLRVGGAAIALLIGITVRRGRHG